MSMPAVTLWWWDMAGVLLPLRVHALDLRDLLYASHRRLRAEHNLGLLIPFGPGLYVLPRKPLRRSWWNKGKRKGLEAPRDPAGCLLTAWSSLRAVGAMDKTLRYPNIRSPH